MVKIFEEFCDLVDKKVVHNLNWDNPDIVDSLRLFFDNTSEHRLTRIRESVKDNLGIEGNPRQEKYWLSRGWDKKKAQDKISDFQSKIGKQTNKNGSLNYRFTKQWFIDYYGEEEGLKRYHNKNYRCGHSLQRNIERYGYEEGYKKYKERCKKSALTKEKMIEKYGEDEEIKRWEGYRNKQSYTCTLDYFIEKDGNEGERIWYECYKNFGGRSAIAEDLFENLSNQNAYYGENEYFIALDKSEQKLLGQKIIRPDFLVGNKVIEFFGDNIHGNPRKFTSDDILSFFRQTRYVKDIWDIDNNRLKILNHKGYKTLVIWEAEYKEDPSRVISRCEAFLNQE